MKTPIRKPWIMLCCWFGLGWAALEYGLPNIADWVAFCFGAVGLYWLFTNRWNS